METIRQYVFAFFGALFMEEQPDGKKILSLGRCMLVGCYIVLQVLWYREVKELPSGLLEVFYALLAYVLGSKAVSTAKAWVATKSPCAVGEPPNGSESGSDKVSP